MAYPPAYVRAFSFTDYEVNFPGEPKPGDKLDTEYDAVANALTGTQTALALIQRADGALANDSVGADQLQDDVFDGIVDGITDDAEAAAAAAAASASAAAGSASSASTSASAASASAGTASGAAAQAGVSQGIAQTAANEAALSATDADNAADVAVQAANDTSGSVAQAQLHEETAFKWAEYLTGPVLPAPPGWPEAVDDGMFSAKWWAIRARDYMTVTHLELGSGQADIGQALEDWLAIPGNEMPLGLVYATWGDPPLEYALTDPTDPTNPDSWTLITGGVGPPGPGNTLTIGTVTTGAVGQPAAATITGVSPDQVLNLTLPTGATGPQGVIGPAGPPNALSIGTVTTVPDGTPSSATITGTAPTQVLNLTLTAGPQGIQGIQGPVGPAGTPVFADPTALVTLVNQVGDSTAAMRSDAAPALDQSIAPTWTGAHTFTNAAGVVVANGAPLFLLNETDGAADAKLWRQVAASGSLFFDTRTDANGAGRQYLQVNRTGVAITGLLFGNAADNPTYNFLGVGTSTFGGAVTTNGNITVNVAAASVTINSTSGVAAYLLLQRAGVQKVRFGVEGAAGGAITGSVVDDALIWSPAGVSFSGNSGGQQLRLNGTTGALEHSAGSAASPSITFSGDTDTGIYRVSAKVLGLTTAGALRALLYSAALEMQSGVKFFATDGTLASPGIAFTLDNDTGFYRFAADLFVAVAGATSIVQFVGPAASSLPRARFDAVASFINGTATFPAMSFENDLDTGIYRGGGDDLTISAGGTAVAHFTSNAGATPQIRAVDGTLANPAFAFHSDPDTGFYRGTTNYFLAVAGGSYCCGFYNQGANAQTIFPDGSAGAPAIAFGADLDTGFYRWGSNAFSATSGGVATMSWVGVQSRIQDGGTSAPSLAFENDLDTGMYRATTDTLDIACGGAVSARFVTYGIISASFNSSSSRAIKRETGKPSRAADILSRLRPILYRLLADDSKEQLGLIAEEVHELCPQLSDGKSVSYDRLALLLLADWQESRGIAA